MDQIIIQHLSENKINITVPDVSGEKANGYLLNNTGVNLQKFSLIPGSNDITLKKQKPGIYVLRIETNNEVAVKQILISK